MESPARWCGAFIDSPGRLSSGMYDLSGARCTLVWGFPVQGDEIILAVDLQTLFRRRLQARLLLDRIRRIHSTVRACRLALMPHSTPSVPIHSAALEQPGSGFLQLSFRVFQKTRMSLLGLACHGPHLGRSQLGCPGSRHSTRLMRRT